MDEELIAASHGLGAICLVRRNLWLAIADMVADSKGVWAGELRAGTFLPRFIELLRDLSVDESTIDAVRTATLTQLSRASADEIDRVRLCCAFPDDLAQACLNRGLECLDEASAWQKMDINCAKAIRKHTFDRTQEEIVPAVIEGLHAIVPTRAERSRRGEMTLADAFRTVLTVALSIEAGHNLEPEIVV